MDNKGGARARIEALNPRLNAFVSVVPPSAPVEGPLAGLSVAVKDCFYDGGRVPTMGSLVPPPSWEGTAEVLRRLRASGADLVGYTNLHEWAIGGTSAVTATGPVRNPWDIELVPGGSSGGSAAALAAGLVDVAVGTDTGGSIRIPAGCCGVVGLKPTQGRVPTTGYVGDGGPTDQIGPMARSVELTRRLFECLIGEPVGDLDAGELRIGIATGPPFDDVQPEVGATVDDAVTTLAAIASTVTEVTMDSWDEQWWANAALFINDTALKVAADLEQRPERFQPAALEVLRWGLALPTSLIARQYEVQAAAKLRWAELFGDIDVLVTPTLPSLPPAIADLQVVLPSDVSHADRAFGRLCGPMNLVGVPCLSLPAGAAGELTTNISLTAAAGRDDYVLAVGKAYENATERRWVERIAAL